VHIGVGIHAARNGAYLCGCLYDGHCHPFLTLKG